MIKKEHKINPIPNYIDITKVDITKWEDSLYTLGLDKDRGLVIMEKPIFSSFVTDTEKGKWNTASTNATNTKNIVENIKMSGSSTPLFKDGGIIIPTIAGPQGVKGEKGDTGPQGEKGDTGLTGAKGDTGPQGLKGDTGAKGDTGSKGEKGEKGEKGDKGDKGDDGFIGSDGKSAYEIALETGFTGTKEEWLLSLKGNDGTMSFEELTPEQKLSLKGETGEQGIQGDKGEKGDKGDKGDTGNQGLQGLQGADGYTPKKGIDYFDGEPGPKGDKGDIGLTGEQGIQGIQGPKGNDGYTPIKGVDYFDGIDGEQGPKGDTGEKGDKGEQGNQGEKGDKGDAGSDANVTKDNVEIALGYTPLPLSGGILNDYVEKLVIIGEINSINLDEGNTFLKTISADTTFSIDNTKAGAHSFTLIIEMNTLSALTFPTEVKWQDGEVPDMSEANKTYILTFLTIDKGLTWFGMKGGTF